MSQCVNVNNKVVRGVLEEYVDNTCIAADEVEIGLSVMKEESRNIFNESLEVLGQSPIRIHSLSKHPTCLCKDKI